MSYKVNTTTKVIRAQLEKPLADVGIDTNRHIERMQFNGRYQKLTIVLKSNVDVCICGKDKRIIYDVKSGEMVRTCGKHMCPMQIYSIDMTDIDRPIITEIGTAKNTGIEAAVHFNVKTTSAYQNPMVVAATERGLKLAKVLKKLQANEVVYPRDVYDGKNWWYYEDHIWKTDR